MIRIALRFSRPLHLALGSLTYLLGVSIASYLGKPFRADLFWLGLLVVSLVQSSMGLLAAVFRGENEPILENETPAERFKLRNNILYIALAYLATAVTLVFVLFNNGDLTLPVVLSLFLSLLVVIACTIPPFRMLNRGFGEFLVATHLAYVIPSIGFLLQAGEFHRLLFAVTLPVTLLAISYFLILDFPTFAIDQKYQRITLLRRLTWERAVPLHHSLLVGAFLLFLAASILGLSFRLLWPAFLTLPFALLQIVLLRSISLGARPNWTLLTSTALGVFGLTTYFLTLTFWIR